MTALELYLKKLITAQGPLPIASFMAEALGNSEHGYYMKKDPFGQQGDFTTAPEISQMFGEIMGIWLATIWMTMGSPPKIHLGELGPGRGTLLQDILRTLNAVPNLCDALKVHLVEMSPILQKIQAENLKKSALKKEASLQWHRRVSDLLQAAGGAPLLLIANEFFDALPVRQYQRTDTGWHERLICLNKENDLCLQLAPAPSPEHLIPPALHRAHIGAIAEVCALGENICFEIADYVKQYGGAALFIDYGHSQHGTGDTLQGVKQHQYHDILSHIGDTDLTAHVNFQSLKDVALTCNARTYGPILQGDFLRNMGIEARSQSLLAKATDPQKKDILSALHRLTAESEMGTLFKVMAITAPELTDVVGFEG